MSIPAFTFRWGTTEVPVVPGQTVLEALEAVGVAAPSSCRAGVCQACLVQQVRGVAAPSAREGLSPGQVARGLIKACVAHPCGDWVLRDADSQDRFSARVVEKIDFGRVVVLRLSAPDVPVRGGQFVHVEGPEGVSRPYSVASASGDYLELHIGIVPGGAVSPWLSAREPGEVVWLRGPLGTGIYVDEEPDTPLLLAGLSTGIAPILGVLREAVRAQHRGPIWVFYGARTAEQLVARQALRALVSPCPNVSLRFYSLLPSAEPDVEVGELHTTWSDIRSHLPSARVYLCGAPDWVSQARRAVFLLGASLVRIHSDPFVAAAGPRGTSPP